MSQTSPHRSGGLYRRLVWSHTLVAAFGLLMLLAVFVMLLQVRTAALRSAKVRGPAARASTLALEGVERSLAGLRGWIALGDPEFRQQRHDAWEDDIEPALDRLDRLVGGSTIATVARKRSEAVELLGNLKKTQWWIEDVAQTPGNEPARVIWEMDVEPIATELLASIDVLIELEKTSDESRLRKSLVFAMADLRHDFVRATVNQTAIVELGSPVAISDFRSTLVIAWDRLAEIAANQALLSEEQSEVFTRIRREFAKFAMLCDDVIEARKSSDWNVALYLLREEAIPQARRARQLLTDVSEHQETLMSQDARRVETISNITIGVGSALIFSLLLVTMYLSRRNASQLAKPITTLSLAARRVASGELTEDVPVTSDDELGDLTRTFNVMRANLGQRDAELKEAVKRLEHSEGQIRSVVETAATGMVSVGVDGTMIFVNSALERLFGYQADELVGQRVEMLIPMSHRRDHEVFRTTYARDPVPREMGAGRDLTALRKDGTEIEVEIALNPIDSVDGPRVLATVFNITERKHRQDELNRYTAEQRRLNELLQRSNEDLQQFAYVASHDLQEPLRAVAGHCQLLEQRLGDSADEDVKTFLGHATAGAQRMQDLIRSLLDYSRVESHGKEFQPVDLNDAVNAALLNLQVVIEENSAEITANDLPLIVGDPSQLTRLFQNLIGNAIKFRRDEIPRIQISAKEHSDPEFWEIAVRDNGIGVEKEYAKRIFVIFQRLHTRSQYPGTGLGLAITKRVVERHGGKIWVESVPAKGSTFCFTIPRNPSNPQ